MTTFQKNYIFLFGLAFSMMSLPMYLAQCHAGQYLSPHGCEKCPEGYYMEDVNHSNTECKLCDKENGDKWLQQECNATHNSIVVCKNGTYNENGHPPVCQKCTQCKEIDMHEVEECKPTSDAICCPGPEMRLDVKNSSIDCLNKSTHGDYCCIPIATTTSPKTHLQDQTTEKTSRYNLSSDSTSTDSEGLPDNVNKSSSSDGCVTAVIVLAVLLVFTVVVGGIILFKYINQRRIIKRDSKTTVPKDESEGVFLPKTGL